MASFANETVLAYVVLALIALIIGLCAWIIRLEYRLRKLMTGKRAESLETTIGSLIEHRSDVETFRRELARYLDTVESRLRRSIQSVEMIRFNPFKSAGGGNQSFAATFLSEDGNGIVLSSLYSRDRMSVYAKPVKEHVSQHELTEEEQQVLASAKRTLEKVAAKGLRP